MGLKAFAKNAAIRATDALLKHAIASGPFQKLYLSQGQIAARQIHALDHIETLRDVEFSIFSQWGEDGIIEWLVHHIGPTPELFVEFGVEDYREANTRFLLENRNWRGLVMDGSTAHMSAVRGDHVSWRHDLQSKAAFVTRENVNALTTASGFTGEIGILSIDVDGNDYWIWEAVSRADPQIVIVEYNAVFGDLLPVTVPYDARFVRGQAHSSNLYYGASIAALTELGRRKGYTLLGSNSAGVNAFFVRNDLALRFLPRISDTRPCPSRFRESRDRNGKLTYVGGLARAQAISDCEIVDLRHGKTSSLGAVGELNSPRWKAMIEGRRGE